MTRNHIHTITRATAQSRLNQLHTLEHISQQVPTDPSVPTLLHAAFGEMEFALNHLAQHRFSAVQDSLSTAQHYANDIIQRFHAIPPMDLTQVKDHNEQLRQDLPEVRPHMTCSDMDHFCQHLHIGPTVQSSCPATCERVRQQQPLAHATRDDRDSPGDQMNRHSPLSEARQRYQQVQQHRQKQAQHSDQAGQLQQMLRLVDQEIRDVHLNHAQSKHGVHQRHVVPQDHTNEPPGLVHRKCQFHQHTHTFTCDRSDPHCLDNSSTLCSLRTIRQRLEGKRRHLHHQLHHLETVGPLL